MSLMVNWTRQARLDLLDIYEFIGVERHNRTVARNLILAIRRKAETYARNPELGTLHPEIELPPNAEPIRSFRVKSYLAFYQKTDASVQILRVSHGRRDFPSLF